MNKPALPVLGDALLRKIAHVWIVLAGAFCAFDLWRKTGVALTDGDGRPIGDDFVNYFSGAYLALHQRVAEIYNWPAYHAFQEQLVGAAVSPNYNYSYPPLALVLTLPFAILPYVPALGVWLIGGWYAFYRALRLATPNALLLSLAAPAVFVNTYCGQNGVWTAAFLGGGLCLLERRPIVAGVLFGLQAYKPHLALMIPVALLAGRQWRAIAAAASTVGVLLLASLALAGWDGWRAFLDLTPLLRKVTLEDADAALAPQRVGVHGGVAARPRALRRICGADRGGADRRRAGRIRVVQGCARSGAQRRRDDRRAARHTISPGLRSGARRVYRGLACQR